MKTSSLLFITILMSILLMPLVLFGKSDSQGISDSSSYCISCHVMQAEYEAWMHSGAHRRKKCVDCHLPNENVIMHYIWKSIDGMKDVGFFFSGLAPEQIKITDHGKKVLLANCIRCHGATVAMINQERPCWDCHRRIAHKRTGAIQTL